MCRVDERVYIGADGHRQRFEDAYPCDKAPRGKLCSKVKRKTTEYWPRATISRGDTPSPASNNPPTPTGPGTYLVKPRRQSMAGARPSTRDGPKAAKPEIVISFGSKKEDGKTRPSVSVSTKSHKHSSKDASFFASNDFAIDSPGSDASNTIRTGFSEKVLPSVGGAFGRTEGFVTTPGFLQGLHHHPTSSISSYTSSSQTPSLQATSDPDYDSPTGYRSTGYPQATVHNSLFDTSQPLQTASHSRTAHPHNAYRTTVVAPQGLAKDTHTSDGLYPLDFSDVIDRPTSFHASSGAPKKHFKGVDREHKRKEKDGARQRQEEIERQAAEQRIKEDNAKQVQFELGRAQSRARERAENMYAEQEKMRAEEREKARRQKEKEREEQDRKERKKEKEREEQDKKDRMKAREREEQEKTSRKREKTKPPTNDFTAKRPGQPRRMSMTQAQSEEQQRLLAAEGLHMRTEREAAEARERLEANAALFQQQQASDYFNHRTNDRGFADSPPPIARRNSMARQSGIPANVPQATPARLTGNRRASIVQPDLPAINVQIPPNYSARGIPSARQHAPPPSSFSTSFHQGQARPPSARRPSHSQENQTPSSYFARNSGSTLDDPFGQPHSTFSQPTFSPALPSPSVVGRDPWDVRGMGESLPNTRQVPDSRNTLQRRGEDVINRAGVPNRVHLSRPAGFDNTYALASDSEDDDVAMYRRTRRV